MAKLLLSLLFFTLVEVTGRFSELQDGPRSARAVGRGYRRGYDGFRDYNEPDQYRYPDLPDRTIARGRIIVNPYDGVTLSRS